MSSVDKGGFVKSSFSKSRFLKLVIIAFYFTFGTAVIIMTFGLFTRGSVNFDMIFNACFFIGALIICVALVMMFLPYRVIFEKLSDHSNVAERYREQRDQKNLRANEYIFVGIMVIMMTGLAQLIVWHIHT